MTQIAAMTREEARAFAERWLPAWTGNQPERLLSFYTDDALYSDPAVPDGLRGADEILPYFKKLLARYPDWVWTQRDAIPLENGFLNLWRAEIPHEGDTLTIDGVCSVQIRDGRIYANHVYFDRSPLLSGR